VGHSQKPYTQGEQSALREQVTAWPTAEQAGSEPTGWKVRPASSVSLTVKPPVLSDGPPL